MFGGDTLPKKGDSMSNKLNSESYHMKNSILGDDALPNKDDSVFNRLNFESSY